MSSKQDLQLDYIDQSDLIERPDIKLVEFIEHYILTSGIQIERILDYREDDSNFWHDCFQHMLLTSALYEVDELDTRTRSLSIFIGLNNSFSEFFTSIFIDAINDSYNMEDVTGNIYNRAKKHLFAGKGIEYFYNNLNLAFRRNIISGDKRFANNIADFNFSSDINSNLYKLCERISLRYYRFAVFMKDKYPDKYGDIYELDLIKYLQDSCTGKIPLNDHGRRLSEEMRNMLHPININDLIEAGVYSDIVYGYTGIPFREEC